MVEITALAQADNVTLLAGATQYWRDDVRGAGIEEVVARQMSGRILIVGHATPDLLRRAAATGGDVHILVRGIPDATETGEALPSAKVWCGDPADLVGRAGPFDTVVVLADVSDVLPLESEARPWRCVVDDLLALGAEGASVLVVVENDLGVHRLMGRRHPRASDTDRDWDPTATWDASRPRSAAQLRAEFPQARAIHCLWPHPVDIKLIAGLDADPAAHGVYAAHASAMSPRAADPAWPLTAYARAGTLVDAAPAWLVGIGGVDSPPFELSHDGGLLTLPSTASSPTSVLLAFAELAAAHDLPGIRRLVSAWAQATRARNVAPAAGLCLAAHSAEGWHVDPVVPAAVVVDDEAQWRALAELVAVLTDRAWRRPWPSTAAPSRILNHLGIMAGLHTVSEARARQLLPRKKTPERFQGAPQELLAVLEQQARTIDTLRSKWRWTELMLEQEREQPAAAVVAVARMTGKRLTQTGRKSVEKARRVLGRLIP